MQAASVRKGFVWLTVCAVIVLPAASALAEWTPGSGARIVRIDASNQQGSGFLQWVFTPGPPIDGTWTWRLPPGQEHRQIKAGAEVIAELADLALEIQTDPAVSLAFALTAGNFDTNITISSATLGFPAIVNPAAFATAAVTVTDLNSNGATLTGLQAGGKAYEARYNNPAVAWADLVSQVIAGQDSSNIGAERQPLAGRQTILATVDRIESEFKFTLSAQDSASGTSAFDVIPEPATALMGVLGLGFIALKRRR